jgi:hypothetical protein
VITFKLTDDAGTESTVEAKARDVLMWERTTKGAKFGDLADGLELSHLYKIAWYAAKRTSAFAGDLKEFEETYDVEPEGEEDSDPTNGDR